MSRSPRPSARIRGAAVTIASALFCAAAGGPALAAEPSFPISPQQRGTAQQVAQAGVPLSALAPNAPDSHTVQRGDTLWDLSSTYYRNPWLYPVIARANGIKNPDLIIAGARIFIPER